MEAASQHLLLGAAVVLLVSIVGAGVRRPQGIGLRDFFSLHCRIKCDWKQAAKLADILRNDCAWSPATYTYQSATLNCMSESEASAEDLKKQTMELLKKVPSLRIRYAGKTIPAEKFAITTSERYVTGEKELIAPALEFMYIWNIWAILEKKKELVDPLLAIIESKVAKLANVLSKSQTTWIPDV